MNWGIVVWLWCLMWMPASEQCTRCGGNHRLSECKWPAAGKEV